MAKNVISLAVGTLMLAMGAAAEETVWRFDAPEANIGFVMAEGDQFEHAVSDKVKTPAGDNTLEVRIVSLKADSPVHAKQINFLYDKGVKQGEQYRLTFQYRGSVAGTIPYMCAQMYPRFEYLGEGGNGTLNVLPEWRTVSTVLTVTRDAPPPLSMPRLMPGQYPVGGVFHLGPVRLEKLGMMLPLALSKEWRLLRNPVKDIDLSAVPASAEPVALMDDKYTFVKPDGRPYEQRECAVFYNTFDSAEDGLTQIGIGADWWFECFVNGKKVYDTTQDGNSSNIVMPRNQIFNFPVKRGENVMAVKVYSGSKGWCFAAGAVPYTSDPEHAGLFRVTAGPRFRPIAQERRLVKRGTALDLSELNGKRGDINALGRIIVGGNGKFAFQNAPGREIRFLGFNYGMNDWRAGNAYNWTHADVEKFAEAVALRGYNMVRLHFVDMYLMGFGKYSHRDWTFKEAPLPLADKDIPFDPKCYDTLEYLIACLKKHGVYINLDLMSSDVGYSLAYKTVGRGLRDRLFYDADARRHWRIAAEHILTKVNPYTNTKLKDDPVLANVDFFNENDLVLRRRELLEMFTGFYRTALREKYGTDAALSKAWGRTAVIDQAEISEKALRSGSADGKEAGDFMIKRLDELTAWYIGQVREIGYGGLFNVWDMIMRTMEFPARAKLPVIAQHTYNAHPGVAPTKNLVEKTPNAEVGGQDVDLMVDPGSAMDSSYFRAAAAVRFLDRPFIITEYSHGAPNQYRHERGLYFGSYAALQGWSALTPHMDLVRLAPGVISNFESANDPISCSSDLIAAFVFGRGDVKEAPHTLALEIKAANVFPKHYLSAIGDDYAQLAMLTKIGVLYPEIKPAMPVGSVKPDITIAPEQFAYLSVGQWYVSAQTTAGKDFLPPLIERLRAAKILPASNQTDSTLKYFESETGELKLDAARNTMRVVTPRLEGAVIKENKPVKLDMLDIASCSVPASITAVALDGKDTLETAKHVLLVIATRAFNSDMVFENESCLRCASLGGLPVLIEAGVFDLSLKTRNSAAPEVFALHEDGTRSEQLASSLENGKLALKLDTSKLKFGSQYFEIIYP